MIMWGSLDDGRSIYDDEKVRPIAEKLAKQFFWKKSTVYPQAIESTIPEEQLPVFIPEAPASTQCHKDPKEAIEFIGPVEGRIVRGTDNRLYAADFLHTSPADVFWSEEHEKLLNKIEKSKYFLYVNRTSWKNSVLHYFNKLSEIYSVVWTSDKNGRMFDNLWS